MATQQQVTAKEIEMIRYINQNQSEINSFFKDMRFKSKQFQQNKQQNNNQQQTQTKTPTQTNYRLNYRGQKVFSIQQLKKKYQNAIFGTKWWQLPYCRRNILGKVQFWLGASFIFTYMYSSYYMRKKNLSQLNWKFYRNTYGAFALASVVYAFTESLLFEPYCDINSYHYKSDDNIAIARDIKKQLLQINGKK